MEEQLFELSQKLPLDNLIQIVVVLTIWFIWYEIKNRQNKRALLDKDRENELAQQALVTQIAQGAEVAKQKAIEEANKAREEAQLAINQFKLESALKDAQHDKERQDYEHEQAYLKQEVNNLKGKVAALTQLVEEQKQTIMNKDNDNEKLRDRIEKEIAKAAFAEGYHKALLEENRRLYQLLAGFQKAKIGTNHQEKHQEIVKE